MQTVDTPGDYCHSPAMSVPLSFTLTPPPSGDGGASSDAGLDASDG